ncbi:MAG: ThuA domain-containing protein [Verrucomicrobia bacterium]|nr:ThuA domain-containing protein [Verrucomicrobiota bacterium]
MNITRRATLVALLLVVSSLFAGAAGKPKKLLVVTVTSGFRHSSIATAEKVLSKLATESGAFTVDFVRQPPNEPQPPQKPAPPKNPGAADEQAPKAAEAAFPGLTKEYEAKHAVWVKQQAEALKKLSAESLKAYDGVVFANTTGDLPLPDNQAFVDWLRSGKAFIGTHSASDTFHGFHPYVEALGAEFLTHGAQATVECLNQDPKHPACAHLEKSWKIHDEIYIMKSFERPRVHGLLSLNKHPNENTPGDYPIAWCREVGKGRIFYTSLGHREDVWENPVYQKHLLGGIRWALKQAKGRIHHAP